MTQTHAPDSSNSVWVGKANHLELKLRDVIVWARQNGAEMQGHSIDLQAAVTLPGVVGIVFDRRLSVSGGGEAFHLTDMPEDLVAPLRRYVEEAGSYASTRTADRHFSDTAVNLHFFTLMTAGPGLVERLA